MYTLLTITKSPWIHDVPRWLAREAGQQSRVVELEGPGQLGKQGRAEVEQHSLTARKAGPAGQKLQLTFLVFHTCHNLKEYGLFVFSLITMVYLLFFLVLKLGTGTGTGKAL